MEMETSWKRGQKDRLPGAPLFSAAAETMGYLVKIQYKQPVRHLSQPPGSAQISSRSHKFAFFHPCFKICEA